MLLRHIFWCRLVAAVGVPRTRRLLKRSPSIHLVGDVAAGAEVHVVSGAKLSPDSVGIVPERRIGSVQPHTSSTQESTKGEEDGVEWSIVTVSRSGQENKRTTSVSDARTQAQLRHRL